MMRTSARCPLDSNFVLAGRPKPKAERHPPDSQKDDKAPAEGHQGQVVGGHAGSGPRFTGDRNAEIPALDDAKPWQRPWSIEHSELPSIAL
jgi:hypothetical protein